LGLNSLFFENSWGKVSVATAVAGPLSSRKTLAGMSTEGKGASLRIASSMRFSATVFEFRSSDSGTIGVSTGTSFNGRCSGLGSILSSGRNSLCKVSAASHSLIRSRESSGRPTNRMPAVFLDSLLHAICPLISIQPLESGI
jgi:hypothetical protein